MSCLASPVPPIEFLEQHDLIWEAPPVRWLEGIPLANGDIGALIWGDGNPLRLTLDKYDAWETREKAAPDATYQRLRQLVEEGKEKEAEDLLACWRIYSDGQDPTRLPLPRLELAFAEPFAWGSARLRLGAATSAIEGKLGEKAVKVEALVHANHNLVLLRLSGDGARPVGVKVGWDHLSKGAKKQLERWGYPAPEVESDEAGGSWYLKSPTGYELAIVWRHVPSATTDGAEVICVAVASSADAPDPLRAAKKQCDGFSDYEAALAEHRDWWAAYWERSYLTIPDARLESLYYAEMYKLGCCSRPGELPITLQGLWTLDGAMPPWSGDYHLDMNVEQSYWPIYTANRLDLGEPLYRTFSACLPRWREQCQQFFGFDGLWAGCAIGPRGERIFGYSGVEFWPGNVAWLAHHYWLHYLYSQDEAFLRDEALPIIEGAFLTYANLIEPGDDGKLHVPLSYSPEWGEGDFEGYCSDPNCDLALIRFLAGAIVQGHEILSTAAPIVERAQAVLAELTDYVRDDNRLLISAGRTLSHSHRHHSHLMAIHPLGLITRDGSDDDRDLIKGSLLKVRRRGTGEWTGWAYPWMSLIASRAGYGNMAWQMLDAYANGFIMSNTFHINGDPRIFGLSQWDYEPMTLEAGFGAAAAIMEMLLQSYGGIIQVFPTVPDRWHDAYFADLRAEGAFLVTSRLDAGQVPFVRIQSEKGRTCRIRNPFDGEGVVIEPLTPGASAPAAAGAPLSAETLVFETAAETEYLLYPEGKRPAAEVLSPPDFPRTTQELNFYGKKRHARF